MEYEGNKQECIEKSKLNIAACCIKLDDHMGCIGACQEILNVSPASPHACAALLPAGILYEKGITLKSFWQ
jgi:hypothetical protein